ncbi:MAG TPA: hypothetical protein VM029_17615, partial [Opitutaceae bacterium]|nr:hypothetical protein [Opitutaceae bacterium]
MSPSTAPSDSAPPPTTPEALPLAAEMLPEPALPVAESPPLIAEPPLLAVSAPPLLSSPRLTTPWIVALIIVGLLQLFLGFKVPYAGPLERETGYRIGTVIGGTVFWPLLVIGLFSIGRRFRNGPARARILVFTWCFCMLGHLGNIGKVRSMRPDSRRDAGLSPSARRAVDLPDAAPRPRAAFPLSRAPAVAP